MWLKKEIETSECVGKPLEQRAKSRHETFCALCGVPRFMCVNTPTLTSLQHIQIVLSSVFLAWALFPLFGIGSFFLYPFVWAIADLGKKGLFRRGAQCKSCGFDAMTYKKDVRKAKVLVKNHLDNLPNKVHFKNGYRRKPEEQENTTKNYFNI